MIACPNCQIVLPVQMINTGRLDPCPQCRARVRADLFNAFYRPVEAGVTAQLVKQQGQAECFYHPGKQALAPCAGCGRLLCALCEVPIDGQSFCLACLQAGRNKGRIDSLQNKRLLYDRLALTLAFWPIFFFFITPITAPAAIYVALRYWRTPGSILAHNRFRFVLAILLALAQLTGWGIFLVRLLGR